MDVIQAIRCPSISIRLHLASDGMRAASPIPSTADLPPGTGHSARESGLLTDAVAPSPLVEHLADHLGPVVQDDLVG